jgi:hypothetical protein
MACFQVSPRSELTADAMLNTSDRNQNEFTASPSGLPLFSNENCKVVAVTIRCLHERTCVIVRFHRHAPAEKKVATVDKFYSTTN